MFLSIFIKRGAFSDEFRWISSAAQYSACRNVNEFFVDELAYTGFREFATITGVLNASKGQLGRGPDWMVNIHNSRFYLQRDPFAAGSILREDGTRQTEGAVVCE